jgi:hypothetical protein
MSIAVKFMRHVFVMKSGRKIRQRKKDWRLSKRGEGLRVIR